MQKSDILLTIKRFITEFNISKEELLSLYDSNTNPNASLQPVSQPKDSSKIGVFDLIAYVGGVIVALGIFILMSLNWESYNQFTRVLISLGSALSAYVIGAVLLKPLPKISPVFYLISGVVLPFGLLNLLESLGLNSSDSGVMTLLAMISSALVLTMYFLSRELIFIVFSVIYASWLFFILGNLSLEAFEHSLDYHVYEYQALVVGVSYLLLAHFFSGREKFKSLAGPLYSFGSLFLLGAAMFLGGWSPENNLFWEIITPLLITGVLYYSVKLNRKSLLVWGMIFLVGYIIKISGEYFSGFGWPVALIVAGLLIIFSSAIVFKLRSKNSQT